MTRGLLVIALAGCWRSSPAPTPPVEEPIANRAPADAAVAVAEDPVDAPPPLDASLPPPSVSQCQSGNGIVARVIGLSVTGSATQVTIGAGQGRGVAPDWLVTVGGTPCTMVRVDQNVTRVECVMTPDMIKASPVALLCAP